MPTPIGLVSPKNPVFMPLQVKLRKKVQVLSIFPQNKQMSESCTGKSFSEEPILVSYNPQYVKRLFIELHV